VGASFQLRSLFAGMILGLGIGKAVWLEWMVLDGNLGCYNLKFLKWNKDQTLILEKIQENSIESSLQSSLPYIPIHMIHASHCASYPKVLCVRHEVNM